jgi:hypothetical protein
VVIFFDMGDDRLVCLHLRADFEALRQSCLQVLGALEAMGQGGEPVGGVICFGGFAAPFEPLRHVICPSRFRPNTLHCFDGSSNHVEFLQHYAIAIRVTGGDGRIMANWFSMATKGQPRQWLWELPPGSILS